MGVKGDPMKAASLGCYFYQCASKGRKTQQWCRVQELGSLVFSREQGYEEAWRRKTSRAQAWELNDKHLLLREAERGVCVRGRLLNSSQLLKVQFLTLFIANI